MSQTSRYYHLRLDEGKERLNHIKDLHFFIYMGWEKYVLREKLIRNKFKINVKAIKGRYNVLCRF